MSKFRRAIIGSAENEKIVYSMSSWSVTGATSNQNIVNLNDFSGYISGKTYRLIFDYEVTTSVDGHSVIRTVNTGAFGSSGIIVDASSAGNHKGSVSYDLTAKADGGMLLRFYISTSTVTAIIFLRLTNISVESPTGLF